MKTLKYVNGLFFTLIILAACSKNPSEQQTANIEKSEQTASAPSSPPKLTRDGAMLLLMATGDQPIWSSGLYSNNQTIQFNNIVVPFYKDKAPSIDSLPPYVVGLRRAELQSGLITITPVGQKPNWDPSMMDYSYQVKPTELGKSCITPDGTVHLGTRILIAVTGMTVPSDSDGKRTTTAKFTYKIVLTPYGKICDLSGYPSGQPRANENAVYQGDAQFALYDDGWRVENINFAIINGQVQ